MSWMPWLKGRQPHPTKSLLWSLEPSLGTANLLRCIAWIIYQTVQLNPHILRPSPDPTLYKNGYDLCLEPWIYQCPACSPTWCLATVWKLSDITHTLTLRLYTGGHNWRHRREGTAWFFIQMLDIFHQWNSIPFTDITPGQPTKSNRCIRLGVLWFNIILLTPNLVHHRTLSLTMNSL